MQHNFWGLFRGEGGISSVSQFFPSPPLCGPPLGSPALMSPQTDPEKIYDTPRHALELKGVALLVMTFQTLGRFQQVGLQGYR